MRLGSHTRRPESPRPTRLSAGAQCRLTTERWPIRWLDFAVGRARPGIRKSVARWPRFTLSASHRGMRPRPDQVCRLFPGSRYLAAVCRRDRRLWRLAAPEDSSAVTTSLIAYPWHAASAINSRRTRAAGRRSRSNASRRWAALRSAFNARGLRLSTSIFITGRASVQTPILSRMLRTRLAFLRLLDEVGYGHEANLAALARKVHGTDRPRASSCSLHTGDAKTTKALLLEASGAKWRRTSGCLSFRG